MGCAQSHDPDATFPITVRQPFGSTLTIQMRYGDTLPVLKERIAERQDLTTDQITLLCRLPRGDGQVDMEKSREDWTGTSYGWMSFPIEQRTMDMYKWIDSTPLQLVPAVPDNMNELVAKGLNAAAAMHMGGTATGGLSS